MQKWHTWEKYQDIILLDQVKGLIYDIFKADKSYPALELCHYFNTRKSSSLYNICNTTAGMYGVDAADNLIQKVIT